MFLVKIKKTMKEHYRRGGLGDVKVKRYLNEVLQAELEPIRKRRNELEVIFLVSFPRTPLSSH